MTVQKYSPSAKELANGAFWGPSMGSEINKQVRIGKINGFQTVLLGMIAFTTEAPDPQSKYRDLFIRPPMKGS
jgi:hypothetical protein